MYEVCVVKLKTRRRHPGVVGREKVGASARFGYRVFGE